MDTITISTDLFLVTIGFIALIGAALSFVDDVWVRPSTGIPAMILLLGGGGVFLCGVISGFINGVS